MFKYIILAGLLAGCATAPDPYQTWAWDTYQNCLQTGHYSGWSLNPRGHVDDPATIEKWCKYDYDSRVAELNANRGVAQGAGIPIQPVFILGPTR